MVKIERLVKKVKCKLGFHNYISLGNCRMNKHNGSNERYLKDRCLIEIKLVCLNCGNEVGVPTVPGVEINTFKPNGVNKILKRIKNEK